MAFLDNTGLTHLWQHIIARVNTETNNALEAAKNAGTFDGEDGYTPVRGTDYWTQEDIATIKGYVDEAILNGAW